MQLERNKDIFAAYLSLRRERRFKCLPELCRYMAYMPADQHYISEGQAIRMFRRYLDTGTLFVRTPYKRRMYESFIDVCKSIMEEGETDIPRAVRAALAHKAPCLGLSRDRIEFILRKMGAK
jgi:hypothetical protein